MMPFAVELNFHSDLPRFLRSKRPGVVRQLNERTSVKDAIEACGVPHTEVDLIVVNGEAAGFNDILAQDAVLDVHGFDPNISTHYPKNRLQVREIRQFIADGHLGKMVRDLRLLGIDVAYERDAEDRRLVDIATSENRGLLTRDRRLLMHSAIRHGYYLRSQQAFEQTIEVLCRFNLNATIQPFSRCLRCNSLLESVGKSEIVHRLKPLTKRYYEQFRNCRGCGQIYWSGSHFDKLRDRVEKLRAAIQPEQT